MRNVESDHQKDVFTPVRLELECLLHGPFGDLA